MGRMALADLAAGSHPVLPGRRIEVSRRPVEEKKVTTKERKYEKAK